MPTPSVGDDAARMSSAKSPGKLDWGDHRVVRFLSLRRGGVARLQQALFPSSIRLSHLARLHHAPWSASSRPIGGIIFGLRRPLGAQDDSRSDSVVTSGIATFLIGLLPTYESAGVWAPVLLLVLRVFQGIGIGGEWAEPF